MLHGRHKLEFSVGGRGLPAVGLMPEDGWRGPGQLEASRLEWDETTDTFPMEGRAENRAGPASLGTELGILPFFPSPAPARALAHQKSKQNGKKKNLC